jgi:hypothetical protein
MDLEDFAATQIPIRLVAYRGTILRSANVRQLFFVLTATTFEFFGGHRSANLPDHRKFCTNSHNRKQTSVFTLFFVKIHAKYMLGIRIPVSLNPDLLKKIWILEGTIAVCAVNFQSRNLSCGKICRI